VRSSILLAAGALSLFVAGCGGSSKSSSNTTTSAPSGSTLTAKSSGQSNGSGVITVPGGVGTLRYSCDRSGKNVSATLGGRILATESVYVEGDDHRHLRTSANVIASPFGVSAVRTGTLLWHVVQSTEPRTVDVRILIDFHGSSGAPTCSPTRWTSAVYTISHDRKWSEPPGWL
jgi:hypothetical protein